MNAPLSQQTFPFYTPPEEAVSLLHSRRAASPLACGNILEQQFSNRPYGVLSRHVATPNFELERFIGLVASMGLTPLVLEFHHDKFVSGNPAKLALARMRFDGGTGRNGGPRPIRVLTITDLRDADGLPLCQTTTNWGEGLIPFHHGLLRSRPELREVEVVDGSPIFLTYTGGVRHYYEEVFSLFIRHAILFENFLYTSSEQRFTTEIVLPAFEAVSARHGCQPLVCRLDPPESEGHPYWYQYPDALYEHVAAKIAAYQSRKEPGQ